MILNYIRVYNLERFLMKKIKRTFILSFLLIFLAYPAFAMTYDESINYAMDNFSSDSKINTFYTPDIGTSADSNNPIRTNSEGTNQILMMSWSNSAYNTSTEAGVKYQNTNYDMWLSPVQQLHSILALKGITSGSSVHDAIAQTQGINTTSGNDIILEHWITRDNDVMQRATLNPAMNALPINGSLTAADINILSKSGCADWTAFLTNASTDEGKAVLANALAPTVKSNMTAAGITWTDTQAYNYALFLVKHIKDSFKTNGYPWSGLGYTYDWAATSNALSSDWAKSIRGTTEYVQLRGTNYFQVGAIYSEQSYIYRVKNPVAGDSSTWNNGDFKVTGDLNNLWTGRRFQPNGSSIEVTSTGDIKNGEGILVSSLGYTLNNAGSITMSDSTKKKFSITGSEDIVILLQGNSSDASSQTNTIINSGTIGSSAITTAIKATGDTSITNSGTIIGGLSFIDGTATITATGGTISGGNIITTKSSTETISLISAKITGGSAANTISTTGTLNINAADLEVTGATKVNSTIFAGTSYIADLNIDTDTATFNNTVEVTGANSRLISTGNTTFNGTVTVSDGTLSLYGVTTMPTLNIGSTLDMQNGIINTVTAATTNMTDDVNIYIDATGNSNDSFNTTGTLTTNAHSFVLQGLNFISAPPNNSFTLNDVIKAGTVSGTLVFDTSQLPTVDTAIGTYTLSSSGGTLFGNLSSYNPQVFRGQVATQAAYANQLTTNNVLFDHIDLVSMQILSEEKPNVYASENPVFAPYQYSKKDGGLWYKAFGNIERLQLSQDINTQNNLWGSLVGADFPLVDLKHGWKLLPTAYVGYTGGYQAYNQVTMYQNGGQGGIMGTFYKGDFITSLLANVGGYGNDMNVGGTKDTTGNWFVGVASKSAYNIKLQRELILQPTMLLSYNAFGGQNWDSAFGSTNMSSNMLNGINLAPGINLILNKDTWSVYATTQLMFNIMNGVSGWAGNVELPTIKMTSTYFQYGVGFVKRFKDRLSLYGQIVFSNGVRTGVGFQGGLQWKF